jgi:hypothetical protein
VTNGRERRDPSLLSTTPHCAPVHLSIQESFCLSFETLGVSSRHSQNNLAVAANLRGCANDFRCRYATSQRPQLAAEAKTGMQRVTMHPPRSEGELPNLPCLLLSHPHQDFYAAYRARRTLHGCFNPYSKVPQVFPQQPVISSKLV